MNTELAIKTIRGAIDRFNKLESSVARHQADHQTLISGAAELDDKTCQRFAIASAGLELASTAMDKMRGGLEETIGVAHGAIAELRNELADLYPKIDQAIELKLLKSIPEDLRESTNVRESRVFQTERGNRLELPVQFGVDTGSLKTAQIRDHLNGMLVLIDQILAELKRTHGVAKKYDVAA